MKIPAGIVMLSLSVLIAVQGWTLKEVVALKVAVATLSERVDFISNKPPHIAQTK